MLFEKNKIYKLPVTNPNFYNQNFNQSLKKKYKQEMDYGTGYAASNFVTKRSASVRKVLVAPFLAMPSAHLG